VFHQIIGVDKKEKADILSLTDSLSVKM